MTISDFNFFHSHLLHILNFLTTDFFFRKSNFSQQTIGRNLEKIFNDRYKMRFSLIFKVNNQTARDYWI